MSRAGMPACPGYGPVVPVLSPRGADAAARAAQAAEVRRGDGRVVQLRAPGVLRQRTAQLHQRQQLVHHLRQARRCVGARPRLAQHVLQQQRQVRLVPEYSPPS